MEELRASMDDAGIVVESLQLDGKMHRGTANPSQWAIAFENNFTKATRNPSSPRYIVAQFGDWNGHQLFTYRTKNVKFSKADKTQIAIDEARMSAIAEEQTRRRQDEASLEAEREWAACTELMSPTGYLLEKRLGRDYGAKLGGLWDVVVPVRDVDGKLWSVQRINEQRKSFLTGGKKRGCFHLIHGITSPLYICEGFATAATVHEATGKGAVVAFDCGNLQPVAEALRSKYPDVELIFAGDDDAFGMRTVKGVVEHYNAGRTKAEAAAEKLLARVIFPVFKDGANKDAKDFNDLFVLEGLDAVREQLTRAALPEALAWTAEIQTIEQLAERDLTMILPDWFWSKPSDKNPEPKPTRPKSTLANFKALFNATGVRVRYNVISKRDEIEVPGLVTFVDNQANIVDAYLTSWCELIGLNPRVLPTYTSAIASENHYNPIADWIAAKPWDGIDRLHAFYETVKVKGEEIGNEVEAMKETLLRKWLIQAVTALYSFHGVSAGGILVFLGDQYLGKTRWFKSLLPDALKKYRADGIMLNTTEKDSILNCIKNWLVELGELDATFRKSDVAALKAFITKDTDTLRRHYARFDSDFSRRTVFFASVNERRFLIDNTGNRRYWTLDCIAIDYAHNLDMQQIWAQAKHLYDEGETHWLTHDLVVALNEHNETFQTLDAVEDKLATELNWAADKVTWATLNATEIAEAVGIRNYNKADLNRVAATLRKKYGIESKSDGAKRGFRVPPRRQTY